MRFYIYFLTCMLLHSINNTVFAAKNIILHTSEGDIAFASLKGKWVFINYWASWCHPCLDEIPVLNRFYALHKQEGIALFAVNFDTELTYGSKLNIKYPQIIEDPAQILHLGDVQSLPMTFVFNPNGQLYDVIHGGQTMVSLNAYYKKIKQGFAQAQPSKSHVYKPSVSQHL